MRLRAPRLPQSPLVRLTVTVGIATAVGLLLWLRGPNWGRVGDAFTYVRWEWVAAAVGLNDKPCLGARNVRQGRGQRRDSNEFQRRVAEQRANKLHNTIPVL